MVDIFTLFLYTLDGFDGIIRRADTIQCIRQTAYFGMRCEMRTDENFHDCVKEAYDLCRLPYTKRAIRKSASTYDPTGGNHDYNNYLYTDEKGENVIFDEYGPGCIFRLSFPTVHSPQDIIKFYVDDSDAPTYKGAFSDIFSGNEPGFPPELVDIGVPPHSAFISYVPMPFMKHMKITVECDRPLFYDNIDCTVYPPETKVASWNINQDNSGLCAAFSEGIKCAGDAVGYPFNAAAGQTITVADLQAKSDATVTELRVSANGYSEYGGDEAFADLDDIRLSVSFDGAEKPQINASLADIFGFPTYGIDPCSKVVADDKYNRIKCEGASYRTRSLAAGIDSEGFYLRLPMPFHTTAVFTLTNNGDSAFGGVIALKTEEIKEREAFGYLYIRRVEFSAAAEDIHDINYCDVEGAGTLVGINASMDSDSDVDSSTYLEGDEHIYIDSSKTPQINGTGTEDFYNGAYYWYNGTHSMPLYGCSYNAKWTRGQVRCAGSPDTTYKSAAYRFMTGDAVPFGSSLRFDMEHGFENDRFEKGSAAIFCYLRVKSELYVSDCVNIIKVRSKSQPGDYHRPGESEEHDYTAENARLTECRSRFEGTRSISSNTMTGSLLSSSNGGFSSFTMKLIPESEYVILRRRFEYTFPNQRAEIFIDGESAGIWYDAGSNVFTRLRESEFILPAALTSGKSSIGIKIVPLSEFWSESSYTALCMCTDGAVKREASSPGTARGHDIFPDIAAALAESVEENRPITLSALAAEFYMGEGHMRRTIHRRTGMSYTNFIVSLRVDRGKRLFATSDMTVKEIAAECGFSTAKYFSSIFKKFTGMSCSEYRREAIAKEADKRASDPTGKTVL